MYLRSTANGGRGVGFLDFEPEGVPPAAECDLARRARRPERKLTESTETE